VKSEDPDLDSQKEAVFVAHVKQDVLKLATRSPLDSARAELSKKTNAVNRKEQLMVGVIESDCRETLLRFKRSKKAFGAHIEDRLLAISEKGLQTAHCGPMRFLPGDSFFNKWQVPLVQVNLMPQMEELMYDKLFESEVQTDRLEQDPGEDDGYDASSECQVKHVIPFPHEFHPLLTKEEIHIFKADVVFDLAVGSGYRLLAVIEMNLKGVGCCRNQAQKEWVYSNLVRWVREKRLINFIPPPKPPEIIEYERKNLNSSRVSNLAVANSESAAIQTPSPSPSPAPAQSQIPTTPVAGNRSLLSAFGGIAM
jgi:hypothetical protein